MACHSERKYLDQRLLPAIINFLCLSDEDSPPKNSRCVVLESLPAFEIVFAASILLYIQPVLCYITLHCNTGHCNMCYVAEVLSFVRVLIKR